MADPILHIPDEELILAAEKELAADRLVEVELHLSSCAACRDRQAEFERALEQYAVAHRALGGAVVGGRPALRAPALWWSAGSLAAALLVATVLTPTRSRDPLPDPALTPGAVAEAGIAAVCAAEIASPAVTATTAMDVFERYGIHYPKPRTFEIDYLITPALGGTADIRNLWPQPYSSGEWNSRVKDALEDHLRAMVCSRQLSLAEAQQDIARNWIAAYRKHFRTERPLVGHFSFVKDRPWE